MISIGRKFKNVLRGLKQRWAPSETKRKLWNTEFAEGHWNFIENSAGDMVYGFVQKYCGGGTILDLGCGSGNTGCELDANSYTEYTGIDISDVALQRAQTRSIGCGRGQKNRYSQGDIAEYVPTAKYDVILFRESFYYIPRTRSRPTLLRYSNYLKEDGVIIIRWHESREFEALLKVVPSSLHVVESHRGTDDQPMVLILSRHSSKQRMSASLEDECHHERT